MRQTPLTQLKSRFAFQNTILAHSSFPNADSKSFDRLGLWRTFNERLLASLMLAAILVGGLAYGVHRFQVARCGDALLRFAKLARERNDIRAPNESCLTLSTNLTAPSCWC
jgi:hypothetical protein